MKTKTLIPLAIMFVLPITAIADITPVRDGDQAPISDYEPPYVITTIGNDDAEHIATTAYVKGAYNDAIIAVNTAYKMFSDRMSIMNEETMGMFEYFDNSMNDKRVTIYTTWNDDSANATTQVALSSAQ